VCKEGSTPHFLHRAFHFCPLLLFEPYSLPSCVRLCQERLERYRYYLINDRQVPRIANCSSYLSALFLHLPPPCLSFRVTFVPTSIYIRLPWLLLEASKPTTYVIRSFLTPREVLIYLVRFPEAILLKLDPKISHIFWLGSSLVLTRSEVLYLDDSVKPSKRSRPKPTYLCRPLGRTVDLPSPAPQLEP